jgi:signal transduction histidine kinase
VIENANRDLNEPHESTLERVALRRVASLVAAGAQPRELFAVVAEEVGRIVDAPSVSISRYESDETMTVCSTFPPDSPRFPVGTSVALDCHIVADLVRERSEPARLDNYDKLQGELGKIARSSEMRSSVGVPIVVAGRLWGVIIASDAERLPKTTEARLSEFTELLGAAIADTHGREALRQVADEQSALRRVATLVAQGAAPPEVFAAVSAEVDRVVLSDPASLDIAGVLRFDPGPELVVVGINKSVDLVPLGSSWPADELFAVTHVLQTGRPARVTGDEVEASRTEGADLLRRLGYLSQVASPIVVDGRLWGAVSVTSRNELPPDIEGRLERFTELVATAIANAESRDALARLADEQAALRRVAMLVAQGAEPAAVFSEVGDEIARMLGSSMSAVGRFESGADGPTLVIVGVGSGDAIETGSRWSPDDLPPVAGVLRTERSVRMDEMDWSAGGPIAELARRAGVVSIVASPIFVEGRLWGVMTACDTQKLPPEAKERLEKFSELIATAIGNAESSAELAASRRRIVAAADEARRRIKRDLHDGTQQRLVSLGLALRSAAANVPPEQDDLRGQLFDLAAGLVAAVEDLQEISRGIHPTILSKGGLGPALRILADRSVIPVDLALATHARLEESIEVAAYYVASEALANAAKHSQASRLYVSLERHDGRLLLSVRDDGVGGADPSRGSGLVGLTDRVEALGGSIRVSSPPGDGTQITAELPLELDLTQPKR